MSVVAQSSTASGHEICALLEKQFSEKLRGTPERWLWVAGGATQTVFSTVTCGLVVLNKQTSTLSEPRLEFSSRETFVDCLWKTWCKGLGCCHQGCATGATSRIPARNFQWNQLHQQLSQSTNLQHHHHQRNHRHHQQQKSHQHNQENRSSLPMGTDP